MSIRPLVNWLSGSLSRAAALVALAFLAACGGGGVPGSTATTGSLVVRMVDSPIEGAEHVYVTIASVAVFRVDESGAEVRETLVDTPAQYDLLALQNGIDAVLGGGQFPPGQYRWIRLMIDDDSKHDIRTLPADQLKNYIVIDGTAYPLIVPSGEHTGIKIRHSFTVTAGQSTDLALDFDVRRSVHRCGHRQVYVLRPRMRLIEKPSDGGTLSGAVATSNGTGLPSGAAVSAQQGGVEAASASVDGAGGYSFPGLAPGTYDLIVLADGFAYATETGVVVDAGLDLSGHDFALSPAGVGAVYGVVSSSSDSVTVRLLWNGFVVATTSADATTGDYLFDTVSEGDYTVEATDGTTTDSGTVTVTSGNAFQVDLSL